MKKIVIALRSIRAWALRNFLTLGLLTSIVIALSWPLPGETIASWKVGDYGIVSTINVILIFFISGLTLRTTELRRLLKQWWWVGFGWLSILAVSPCFGFAIVAIPFQPPEFATGLAIFSVVPTSLSSCVVLTTHAHGNAALALLLTVSTNLLGIVTVPFFLQAMLQKDINLEPAKLIVQLVVTILAPTLLGKALVLASPWIKRHVDAHRTLLGLLSSLNLILIAWQGLSKSRNVLIHQRFVDILAIIAAGIALHLILLAINGLVLRVSRAMRPEAIAVLFCTSQKTLPVALTIISLLHSDQEGVLAIPCILAHLAQLLIDGGIVANVLLKLERRRDEQRGGGGGRNSAREGELGGERRSTEREMAPCSPGT